MQSELAELQFNGFIVIPPVREQSQQSFAVCVKTLLVRLCAQYLRSFSWRQLQDGAPRSSKDTVCCSEIGHCPDEGNLGTVPIRKTTADGFWLPEMSDGIADLAGFAPGTCKPPFYIHRPKA